MQVWPRPARPIHGGHNMLDEEFELGDTWTEDGDCGCWKAQLVIDGASVEAHHWIPDDTAPHIPDTACGCGPNRIDNPDGVLLFEHHDQDDPLVSKLWPELAT